MVIKIIKAIIINHLQIYYCLYFMAFISSYLRPLKHQIKINFGIAKIFGFDLVIKITIAIIADFIEDNR